MEFSTAVHLGISIATVVVNGTVAFVIAKMRTELTQLKLDMTVKMQEHIDNTKEWAERHFVAKGI